MVYVRRELIRTDYLPAAPGFFRLKVWPDDGEDLLFDKQAVVGWRVRTYAPPSEADDAHTVCDPVIAVGEVTDGDFHPILRPDGMVEEYDEDACSFDDWRQRTIARLVEDRKQKQEQKAKVDA